MKRIILRGGLSNGNGEQLLFVFDPAQLGLKPDDPAPREITVQLQTQMAEVAIPGIPKLGGLAGVVPNIMEFSLMYVRVCSCPESHDDEVYEFEGFDE